MNSKKKLIGVIVASSIVFLVGTVFGVSYYNTNKAVKQADALVLMEKYEDGIAIYERLLSENIDTGLIQKRDRAKELLESKENYEAGLQCYEDEDFEGAVKAFSKVSKSDSERYSQTSEKMKSIEEYVLGEVESCMASGDFDTAIESVDNYLDINADSVEAKKLKEEVVLKQGESAKQAEEKAKDEAKQAADKVAAKEAQLDAEIQARNLINTYQTVVSKDGNLRVAPKLSAEKIVALPQGTECYVYDTKIETSNRIWCQVSTYYEGSQYDGWISYNTMNYKCD